MRPIFVLLLLLTPLSLSAQESSSGPLFMKHLLGDREFFEPWGVGFDFFTMDQDYGLKNLQFNLPGAGIEDPSKIKVTNELQHLDLQLSVWLTPFLNVFGIVGRIDAETLVGNPADILRWNGLRGRLQPDLRRRLVVRFIEQHLDQRQFKWRF